MNASRKKEKAEKKIKNRLWCDARQLQPYFVSSSSVGSSD